VRSFDAVLFDWSGTLVHDPSPPERIRHALATLGRAHDDDPVDALWSALHSARRLAEVEAALRDEDTSAQRHRDSNMLWYDRAGIDASLAAALYDFDADIANRPLYTDAAAILAALHGNGVKVAVVSDIHLDLRTMLHAQGVGDFVDAYVLSFEHGCQKPDARMFEIALDLLDVATERALMVGDRASHDGGAAAGGIATLILPPPPAVAGRRGLDVVARLVMGVSADR
jgi:HAD superfamily hydrolase (TIGR01549 family)